MHLRPLVATLCAAALSLTACGGSTGASPTPSPQATATAVPTPVPPPAPAAIVQLSDQDLLELAHAHRVRTAAVSPANVTGSMASDIGPDQQFSAPRPAAAAGLNDLLAALRQGGASVTGAAPATSGRKAA